MRQLKRPIIFALMITTLITTIFLAQLASSAITFKEGDLVLALPDGERFYYTESDIKWDQTIKEADLTESTSQTTEGQVQTIETVKTLSTSELTMSGEKKYVEIVMQIPTICVCANQAIRNTDIRILKMGNSKTEINWKKQIIKEANIIRIIGEIEKIDEESRGYEFKLEITYTGEYIFHHPNAPDTHKYFENEVMKSFDKIITIDSVKVGNIEDVTLNTKCSIEEGQYREVDISTTSGEDTLNEDNLSLEIVGTNNETVSEKCFSSKIERTAKGCRIIFWSDKVTSPRRTPAKLVVKYKNAFETVTKEAEFNVNVVDHTLDVN